MKPFKKTGGFFGCYKSAAPTARILGIICSVLYHAAAVLLALVAVISIVVIFVNVAPQKMLLPPRMDAVKDASGAIVEYTLRLGAGVAFHAPVDAITTAHIKTVFYCRAAVYALTLLAAVPVLKLLSGLFSSIASGRLLCEKNARSVLTVGFIISGANLLLPSLQSLFNYIQLNKFLDGAAKLSFVFDADWTGVFTGILIVIIGTVYGFACRMHSDNTQPDVDTDTAEPKEDI